MQLDQSIVGVLALRQPCEDCIETIRSWTSPLMLGGYDDCRVCGNRLAVREIGSEHLQADAIGLMALVRNPGGPGKLLSEVAPREKHEWRLARLDANFGSVTENELKTVALELDPTGPEGKIVVEDRLLSLITDTKTATAWFWPRHGVLAHLVEVAA